MKKHLAFGLILSLSLAVTSVYANEQILVIPDSDGDGLFDFEEIHYYGTDPHNPDTDGDGVNDGDEVLNGTNPLNASWGDVIVAWGIWEFDDIDYSVEEGPTVTVVIEGDIPSSTEEKWYGVFTLEVSPDRDGDGLIDFVEIHLYGTNPNNPDTDGDGVSDKDEVVNGTDPLGSGDF